MSNKIKAVIRWAEVAGPQFAYMTCAIKPSGVFTDPVAVLPLDNLPALVEQVARALHKQDSGYTDMHNYRLAAKAVLADVGIDATRARRGK